MRDKKIYTREEKIEFYTYLVFDLKRKLAKAIEGLERVKSPSYQEWTGSLEGQLKEKKKA